MATRTETSTAASATALLLVLYLTQVSSQTDVLQINPNVRKLLVAEGSKQVLDCFITTDNSQMRAQLINWTRSGVHLFSVNTRTDNKHTYHSILTIESFSQDLSGDYKCSLTLGDVPQEAEITLLTVIESKVEGEFFFGNKSAMLQCNVSFTDSSVTADFSTWMKGNVSLSELKDPERFTVSDSTLLITGPVRTDSGAYIARYQVTGVTSDTYDCQVVYSADPLVLNMAKSKNIVEGDTLHLECLVKGYPPANITWLKDDKPLAQDDNRVLTETYQDYDDARLVIKSTSISDSGVYMCVATGRDGYQSSKFIMVRVKDRLEWLWPVIGILCEAVVLAAVIFICSKFKKDDGVDKPADEREGLLRQGGARNRDQERHE